MKKDFKDFKKNIKDKKVAVIGVGISNTPLIKFLLKFGAHVTAFDKKREEDLGKDIEEFKKIGVHLSLGDNYLDNLKGFDVIFKTPSMRIDNPYLVKARNEGTHITSEMEEFLRYCPAKIFGITGSDGKTTTTTMVYKMLKAEGYKTWLGGNIGTPLFTQIEDIEKGDKVVLELSSFQLMTVKDSPEVAVVTNVTPNHLDVHKSMEEYIEAKSNIFKFQNEEDLLILNMDNSITDKMSDAAISRVKKFSLSDTSSYAYYKDGALYLNNEEICKRSDIKVRGMHNVANLLAAFCSVSEDVSIENMKKVASKFTGVEHRCEFVKEVNGVKYYNDSIATTPTRTLAALDSFDEPLILIAGGYDKNVPFEPLAEKGLGKIKALILTGATKYKIKDVFDRELQKRKASLPIYMCDNFNDAVYKAKEIAKNGDIVALSPACASFDSFPNFETRGNKFKEMVSKFDK